MLTTLFASRARVAIIRLFMLDPLRPYYQRQVEMATGLPIRAVQRELERLTKSSLLYRWSEGNRNYYQADTQFPLYPELRKMVLKTADALDNLRGQLAVDPTVHVVLVCPNEECALVVTADGSYPVFETQTTYKVESMSAEEFSRALNEDPGSLEPFLSEGMDLLGRREHVIWRRIEAAGYDIAKGRGVA